MDSIVSKDGTLIAYEKSGQGAPLVLVHGTSADHTRWGVILPELVKHYTVYAVDRRGRGGSGDNQPYAIDREFEDIAILVDSLPEPVNLLGHSYGAICSLEASIRTHNLRRLVLYEPPILLGEDGGFAPGVSARLKALLARGDRDGLVATFLSEVPRLPPGDLAALRASPSWEGRMASAHTIPRELDASDGSYVFKPELFMDMKTPTLLLLGGDSPTFFKTAIEKIHATLPDSKLVVLPGQQHVAINTASERFTRTVLEFLGVI